MGSRPLSDHRQDLRSAWGLPTLDPADGEDTRIIPPPFPGHAAIARYIANAKPYREPWWLRLLRWVVR